MWEEVRKFGLEYCDLPTMLSNVSTMLRVLTLNIDGRNKNRVPITCYILMTTVSASYFYVYVISGTWFTFWRCLQTGDVVTAMISFSLSSTSEVAIIKLFYMMFYEEKLKKLTSKFLAYDSQTVQGSRFSNNMSKVLRNVKKRGIIFWTTIMVNAVLYVIKPLVMPGQHLTVDNFVIYGLEPMLESPNFELATIIMVIDVLFICFVVANIATFLILIIGYTEAQMLALSEEMIHLLGDAKEYYQKTIKEIKSFKAFYHKNKGFSNLKETDIVNEYVKIHLIDVTRRHATNVDLLQEIEHAMRGPNAVGFLFLIIGLIAELLGRLENTFLQLPFTLTQLGVDCYLGQKIMDANLQFERAVYDCKWEHFNEFNKKIVLVILQNSQKTMTLSAGGMVTLSFSYFMSVIKSTYSVYTTLHSMI